MVMICHVWKRSSKASTNIYSSMLTLLHKAKLVPMGRR